MTSICTKRTFIYVLNKPIFGSKVYLAIVLILVALGICIAVFTNGRESEPPDENSDASVERARKSNDISPSAAKTDDGALPTLASEPEPEPDATVRVKYERSPDMPDGISFISVLMLLRTMKDDEVVSRDWVIQEMGFGYLEAEAFRDRLVLINKEFEEKTAKLQNELLCSDGVPKVYGDEVFPTLELLEDATDAIAEDYFLNLASEIPPPQAQRLEEWIDTQKLSTVAIRHNFKELYQLHNVNGDAVVARLCLPTP